MKQINSCFYAPNYSYKLWLFYSYTLFLMTERTFLFFCFDLWLEFKISNIWSLIGLHMCRKFHQFVEKIPSELQFVLNYSLQELQNLSKGPFDWLFHSRLPLFFAFASSFLRCENDFSKESLLFNSSIFWQSTSILGAIPKKGEFWEDGTNSRPLPPKTGRLLFYSVTRASPRFFRVRLWGREKVRADFLFFSVFYEK